MSKNENKAKEHAKPKAPEKVIKKEVKNLPLNKIPGKYLKFNEIEKGEN
jgi:hypothetical protein